MRFHSLIIVLAGAALGLAACQNPYQYEPEVVERPTEQKVDLNGEFPIIAWTGINAEDTERKFGPMKECGINTYLGWYDSIEKVVLALENAEKAGVKCIIRSETLLSNIKSDVARMKGYSSLMAYEIKDEPNHGDFNWMAEVLTSIAAEDPVHPCYINLYPEWAWGGIDTYRTYLTQFMEKVPVTFLSFDYYPIMEYDGVLQLREGWYANLEDAMAVSKKFKVPMWTFALSLAHRLDDHVYYPVPTIGDLRLQQFCNLVYGAQAFQYFTYWGIYQANATPVYDLVKTVNKELQSLAFIFLNGNVKDVWHTGTPVYAKTKALSALPSGVTKLKTSEKGAVISLVESKDKKTYLAIVNKDWQNDMTLEIAFDHSVKMYDHMGYIRGASTYANPFNVGPGDIVIFEL